MAMKLKGIAKLVMSVSLRYLLNFRPFKAAAYWAGKETVIASVQHVVPLVLSPHTSLNEVANCATSNAISYLSF